MHTLVKVNHMIKDHLSLCVKLLNYQSHDQLKPEKRSKERRWTTTRTGENRHKLMMWNGGVYMTGSEKEGRAGQMLSVPSSKLSLQLKHGSTLTSFKLILKSRESVSVSWIQTVSWIQGRDVGQRKETTSQPSLFVKHGAWSSRSDGTWQFRTLYVKRKIVNAEPETRSWYDTYMISFSSLCFCFVKQPTLLSTGSLWNRLLWDGCGVAYMSDCNEREFVCMTNGMIFIYCAVLWLYLAFFMEVGTMLMICGWVWVRRIWLCWVIPGWDHEYERCGKFQPNIFSS